MIMGNITSRPSLLIFFIRSFLVVISLPILVDVVDCMRDLSSSFFSWRTMSDCLELNKNVYVNIFEIYLFEMFVNNFLASALFSAIISIFFTPFLITSTYLLYIRSDVDFSFIILNNVSNQFVYSISNFLFSLNL